ncbi:MAG: restriction endonuclease [Planctomycetaceae bacterium]|nr:restriction endonuclease [Planctomycetaceae bacterium]
MISAAVYWGGGWLTQPKESIDATTLLRSIVHNALPHLSIGAGIIVMFAWIAALSLKLKSRLLLDSQSGQDSIRRLNWREFEELLCEAFRREGYSVNHVGTDGPDGGVDIRLEKNREVTIVQCKHWKRQQVGVAIVRELFGVMHAQKADNAIVVTSGSFSPDATTFANQNSVRLIDGPQLIKMIRSVQKSGVPQSPQNTSTSSPEPPQPQSATPTLNSPQCPKCHGPMVLRTATKGKNTGQKFWGCRRYPDCRGIVDSRNC